MSNAPITAESVATPTTTPTLGQLARSCGQWLKHNILQAILSALIGAAIGWIVNWYYLAVKYDGYRLPGDGRNFEGSANLITGEGNVMWGALAWALISTIAFGLFGYWRSVGTARFLRELAGLPDRFARLFQQRGPHAWSAILWGVATSMLVSLFISPWLGIVLGAACFVSASSLIGRILSGIALRLWSTLVQMVAPTRRLQFDSSDAVILGMLGSAAALALTFLLPERFPSLRGLALIAAVVGALLMNRTPRTATPLVWLAGAAWLGDLLLPHELWADDGGWVEAGSSFSGWAKSEGSAVVTTYAGGGGAASGVGAAVGNALGHVIGGQSSGPIIDPWTGKPLTPWEAGRFGPGENGQEGKPGDVFWGGNWMDPAVVRERIEESLAADRRRDAESRQFEAESRRLAEQAQREREQRAREEAAREEAARNEAARREAAIKRMAENMTPEQRAAADRIMQGINWANPSREDLDRLRGLSGAMGSIEQGKSEREGAAAETDAANAQLGEDAARVVREIGQAAGETAEQILTGGATRGAITNFVYGAAGAAGEGKGPGEAVANGLRDARDGVIMNVGFGALGRAGVPMPSGPLGQTLLGGAMAAGGAAAQGASGEDILKEGLYGGLGAAASSGFENAAGGHAPGTHVPDDPTTRPPAERQPGQPDTTPSTPDDGTRSPQSEPDRQRELAEALRLQAAEEARLRQEAEATRQQQEADEARARQDAEEARRRREAEEADAERKRREAEEAEAERKRQEEEEADAERKRREAEEADAERKRREAEEAEADRKRQEDEEAEAERRRQEEAAEQARQDDRKQRPGESMEDFVNRMAGGDKTEVEHLGGEQVDEGNPRMIDPRTAQNVANQTTQEAANPAAHEAAMPGLYGEHANFSLSANPNARIPNEPYTTNAGVVITDPFEASLARHAEAKPKDTPWMSFTNTRDRAGKFNSAVIAQVDLPQSQLDKMFQSQQAGRVDYNRMQNEQYKGENEVCLNNVPGENFRVTRTATKDPPMTRETSGPMQGYDYYTNAAGEKVYRLYRGLHQHNLPPDVL